MPICCAQYGVAGSSPFCRNRAKALYKAASTEGRLDRYAATWSDGSSDLHSTQEEQELISHFRKFGRNPHGLLHDPGDVKDKRDVALAPALPSKTVTWVYMTSSSDLWYKKARSMSERNSADWMPNHRSDEEAQTTKHLQVGMSWSRAGTHQLFLNRQVSEGHHMAQVGEALDARELEGVSR